ncbi:recombinase RecT, partial [Escherichia coli]|nr:recombinase RecT [Escherichia coli]
MGLLHIAMESGVISWGQAKLVHANDTYESNGLDKAPTHKYNAFGDRGDIVGVYCTVKTPAGDYLTEEMSLAEIEAVRKTSKAA